METHTTLPSLGLGKSGIANLTINSNPVKLHVRENLSVDRRMSLPTPIKAAAHAMFTMSPREHVEASARNIGGGKGMQFYFLPTTARE